MKGLIFLEIKRSNKYLWDHPEEYRRLRRENIKNNDAVLSLCEMILFGIREECDSIIKTLSQSPMNEKARKEARLMDGYLNSDVISSMSFGGSVELAKQFRGRCPGGIFE